MNMTFPLYRQLDVMDCAPTCLMMVCKYFGRKFTLQRLRELCDKGQGGVTLFGIHKAAEDLGLRTKALRMSTETFMSQASTPCIIHWKSDHFVVVYKITKNAVYIADPAMGKIKTTHQEFIDFWSPDGKQGVALFLESTEKFDLLDDDVEPATHGLKKLANYVFKFKKMLIQLGLGAFVVSALSLVFPFLTQSLVDHGIGNRDISFIYAILIAQMMLFVSKAATEFIRGWILVHMGTRVNIAVISDFLTKLMRLPLAYFERRNLGDVLQRITDHQKIEEFLTSHSLNVIFSMVNLVVFSIIMGLYSGTILAIFAVGTVLSVTWIVLFLNKRKVVDYQQFAQMSSNQNAIVQMVDGMPEIRMNQAEITRRQEWEGIQGKLFNVRLRSLAIEQYQQAGTMFLNESKNILITFLAAYLVTTGEISLGMMMAITYILAQMNAPIDQLINFIRLAQDAKISMERLGEIQLMEEEVPVGKHNLIKAVPKGDIALKAVNFKYNLHDTKNIIDNLSFTIGYKKVTAIVGASGSGKTTLMKLLLGSQQASSGSIEVDGMSLDLISPDAWRSECGVVMQDGYIFSDSVLKNIAMSSEKINFERVVHAAKTANIHSEIESLPQGYMSKIGRQGIGLSGGQRQRILIARAVFKNPEYLFFDEATSSLDANNEKAIQDNLMYFLKGKTAVVIAHRLSTVKNADNIIVLDEGKIVEQGNHRQLTENQGVYFNLVKNQLELGA